MEFFSRRSKRFRERVSEQRNTEQRDFRFWPRENLMRAKKMKEGGWGGEGWKETPADKTQGWFGA